jgi:hypothetical protein
MDKIAGYTLVILLVLFAGASCSRVSECTFEDSCRKSHEKILSIAADIQHLSNSSSCGGPVTEKTANEIRRLIDGLENPREIAALAGALRSLVVYETEVPACKHTRTGNLLDHAFWGCIKKLNSDPTENNLKLLEKIRENSSFDDVEEGYFDSLLKNEVFP